MQKSYLRNQLDVAVNIIFNSTKQWSAYRSNILTVLLLAPLQMIAQYFIWKSVLSSQATINGMSFQNLLTYYAITTIVNMLVIDDMAGSVRSMIGSGNLSSVLIKPVSFMKYSFSEKIGSKVIAFLFEALPMSLIFILIFHINLAPQNIIWAFLSVALSFVLVYLVNFCVGMTSFWFVNNWGLLMAADSFRSISSGIIIPLVFFPTVIQKILFFLPFQYMYYIPAQVILGSYKLAGLELQPWEIVFIQFIYVFLMLILTKFLWRIGIRKYTGVGI